MSGFDYAEEQLFGYAAAAWPTLGQYEVRAGVLADPPRLVLPNEQFTPGAGQHWVQLDIVYTDRIKYGAEPLVHYMARGFIQHTVHVERGSGTKAMATLCDRPEAMWKAASDTIVGFSSYRADGPRNVPAPDDWYAKAVDVSFRLEWSPAG